MNEYVYKKRIFKNDGGCSNRDAAYCEVVNDFRNGTCGPSDKINLGFIGCGSMGTARYATPAGYLLPRRKRHADDRLFGSYPCPRRQQHGRERNASANNPLLARTGKRIYPGIDLKKTGEKGKWEVLVPATYHNGHEAHFGQVTEHFLKYLKEGSLTDWEIPNMIAKYYVTTHALELAKKSHEKVGKK